MANVTTYTCKVYLYEARHVLPNVINICKGEQKPDKGENTQGRPLSSWERQMEGGGAPWGETTPFLDWETLSQPQLTTTNSFAMVQTIQQPVCDHLPFSVSARGSVTSMARIFQSVSPKVSCVYMFTCIARKKNFNTSSVSIVRWW